MRRVVRISDVTEYLAERHCGLMLAARMTLPHFSAGDAPAPRDGRASLRHAQDADGRDALSDEASAEGCHRDGLARARLQSHAGHEYCRREAAHCGGPGVSGGGIAVRMLSAHQIAHSGPGKPSVDSRRAIAKHAKLSPSRRSCVLIIAAPPRRKQFSHDQDPIRTSSAYFQSITSSASDIKLSENLTPRIF